MFQFDDYFICFLFDPFCKKPAQKENYLPFFVLMVYLLFVNKGRQPVALLAIIYAIYYVRMKGISLKRLALGVLPLIGALVLLSFNDKLVDSLIEATKWEKVAIPLLLHE